MLTPLVSISVAGPGWYHRRDLFRLRLVVKSPAREPRATHARTLPLRLPQTRSTTFNARVASYDCPMSGRTFQCGTTSEVSSKTALTMSFAGVCFPPQIEAFLPEGNTPVARLNCSSGTPQVASGAQHDGTLVAYFCRYLTRIEGGSDRVARW
jgi:hypothetical protein